MNGVANFEKHSGHYYTAKNQNGFNNALYDYFNVTNENENKKGIRKMVQNFPTHYPCSFIIINQSFECGRIYIEIINNNGFISSNGIIESIKNSFKNFKSKTKKGKFLQDIKKFVDKELLKFNIVNTNCSCSCGKESSSPLCKECFIKGLESNQK